MPSTDSSLPIAPNFFTEATGFGAHPEMTDRQACYNGALGASAMHALQSYQPPLSPRPSSPVDDRERTNGYCNGTHLPGAILHLQAAYDNEAYAVTATFYNGTLKASNFTPRILQRCRLLLAPQIQIPEDCPRRKVS
ncbi:hypothetical protein BJY04DRAFT_222047 [Aspergillus karnatakaensis]|uniref:uncharacterized protein n=1 Tax=Aspergillus karnatakaensis TaxID=1810916 RepID=UPI003CCE05D3